MPVASVSGTVSALVALALVHLVLPPLPCLCVISDDPVPRVPPVTFPDHNDDSFPFVLHIFIHVTGLAYYDS